MLSTIKKAGVLFRRLTATASDVLSGKVFYGVGSKKPQVGTMTNKAGTSTNTTMDFSDGKVRMVVPEAGYYDTSSYLTINGTELGNAILVSEVEWNANWSTKTYSASRPGIAIMKVRSIGSMQIQQNGTTIASRSTGSSTIFAWCWGRVTSASTISYKWTANASADNRADIECWFVSL